MAPLLDRMDGMEIFPQSRSEYAERKVKWAVRQYEDNVHSTIPYKNFLKFTCTFPICNNFIFPVVLLGNSGVGKTSLFDERSPLGIPPPATIGSSFKTYDMEKEGVSLQVWDTAGQERFRCMVPMYMRNADAAIIVFDITNRQSFEDITKWENELIRCCSTSTPHVVLIGNKADLADKRTVARGEAVTRANQMRATYHEITASSSSFPALLNDLSSKLARTLIIPARSTVTLSLNKTLEEEKRRSSSCCPFI